MTYQEAVPSLFWELGTLWSPTSSIPSHEALHHTLHLSECPTLALQLDFHRHCSPRLALPRPPVQVNAIKLQNLLRHFMALMASSSVQLSALPYGSPFLLSVILSLCVLHTPWVTLPRPASLNATHATWPANPYLQQESHPHHSRPAACSNGLAPQTMYLKLKSSSSSNTCCCPTFGTTVHPNGPARSTGVSIDSSFIASCLLHLASY